MGASNFLRGDEPYIYVPKIFRKKKIDYESIADEIDYIQEAVLDKVRDFLNRQKKLEDYRIQNEQEYSVSFSKNGIIISLYHFFEDGSYDDSRIFFYYVNGYYEAGNFGYEVIRGDYIPTYIDNLTDKVCDIIEEELEKYCDKYDILWKASNGETCYKKVK